MAAAQDIDEEFFVIRYRGSKEKRNLVYDWITGYSSDFESFAEIAPKMTVRRGANLRELLLPMRPPVKKPKTLASFDDVISGRAKIDEEDSDNDSDEPGPAPSYQHDREFNDLIGGPSSHHVDPYQEMKPETFHTDNDTDNDNKEDLASAIAEVNNSAAFGGFFTGENGTNKRKWPGADGQKVVVDESIKSGLWSQEHARSAQNVVSSELLKKHRITFSKRKSDE